MNSRGMGNGGIFSGQHTNRERESITSCLSWTLDVTKRKDLLLVRRSSQVTMSPASLVQTKFRLNKVYPIVHILILLLRII